MRASHGATVNGRNKGFTLIELIVVIFILGLALTLTFPRLQALYRGDVKRGALVLAATIQYLHEEAISKNRFYRLDLDLERGEYWASVIEGELKSAILKRNYLPSGVRFLEISTPDGQPTIPFSPQGWTGRAAIILEDEDGQRLVLETSPLTGRVKISQG